MVSGAGSGVEHAVVVGGGVAGLAAAWSLARRGRRVTLFEQERATGRHASGRNAGLVRQVVGDPALAEVGRRGAEMLRRPPEDLASGPLCRVTGSLLLAGAREGDGLRRAAGLAAAAGVPVTIDGPVEASELLGLALPEGAVVVRTADDGACEPALVVAALERAARARGVRIRAGRPAALRVEGERVTGVVVDGEVVAGDAVVLAAGPWAGELARAAGALDPRLVSRRRHLAVVEPRGAVDARGPWVWDLERGLYARPHDDGLLVSACDEDERPPEDARRDDARLDELTRALRLATRPLRAWAGLRTFAPDQRFVIGRDPLRAGLVWLAGLGGHGLTSGLAVGDLAARATLGEATPAAFDPARLSASVDPGDVRGRGPREPGEDRLDADRGRGTCPGDRSTGARA